MWVQEVKDRFFAVVASIVDTSAPTEVIDVAIVPTQAPLEDLGEKVVHENSHEEDERDSTAGSVGSTVVVSFEAEIGRERKDGLGEEAKHED